MSQLLRQQTLTRLQPGMLVRRIDGEVCLVVYVNDCRASIVPVAKKVRRYTPQTGKNAGKEQVYAEPARGIDISPNSEIEIIGTDEVFLRKLIEKQNEIAEASAARDKEGQP